MTCCMRYAGCSPQMHDIPTAMLLNTLQAYTALGQLREREPQGVLYPTDDHVFISFAVKSLPLVQVVPMRSPDQDVQESRAQEGQASGLLDTPQQSVQRLRTEEYVDLMKAIVFKSKNGTAVENILLVAGQKVTSVDEDSGTAPAAGVQEKSFQFSLYSYRAVAASTFQVCFLSPIADVVC